MHGFVSLVGAGPGDPGLITLKGSQLLGRADVVVYDYLANPALLRHCRPDAELIYVGKVAARHSMTQEEINGLLVEKGKAGKRVVRLKGGDPYVFGRGGEEGEALFGAGVPFETVPGITAAIAGPAYAGIPVTHRDANSSFTLVTGHEKEADYKDPEALKRTPGQGSDVDWAVLAKLPSVAFYMGVKALPGICRNLIENGMSPDMPAATIQWATTARQRSVTGTISTLPRVVADAGITSPAITIVGPNVRLRDTLNWFERRPLFGRTILVTRTRQQASDLSQKLEDLGARILEAPTIELSPPKDTTALDDALRNAGSYDWVIFTSANGVTHTRDRLFQLGLDARTFGRAKIATVGDATAAAVREHLALNVDLAPAKFVAEALAEALAQRGEIRGKRFLLLRADIARPVLRERLEEEAMEVLDIPVYESTPATSLPEPVLEAIAAKQVDWVTFTSSGTAKNLAALLGPTYREQLAGVKVASIGPITTATLRELGLPPTIESDDSNIDGLVAALLKGAGK